MSYLFYLFYFEIFYYFKYYECNIYDVQGNITGQTEDLTTQFYHLVPHVLKSQETLPLLDNLGKFLNIGEPSQKGANKRKVKFGYLTLQGDSLSFVS